MKNSSWVEASLTGGITTVIAKAIGLVDIVGVAKAFIFAGVATVGSYTAQKLLKYTEPYIKQKYHKFKSKFKKREKPF